MTCGPCVVSGYDAWVGTAPQAPKSDRRPEIKPGDLVLDRYRVVEQIASGGHSVVYLGQDERLSRPVCVKVFSGLGGKSGVGRTSYEHFVQEAFALSRLTHPNTLRIYDFGYLGNQDADGMPLQVCEYMNGGTLSHIVREKGPQSLVETARVINAMCAALAEAHSLGIVHRDIKPQNILFGTVGGLKLPKLADFGIAKWSDDEGEEGQRAEDTQIVAGQKLAMYSPSWAAPEQLAGQPVSAATDIYSLAVVAIYMMSGRAIFADEDVYAGYKKRRHADEHVREVLAPLQVPPPVVALLVKALAFDPKKRITQVDELAQGFIAALEARASQPTREAVPDGSQPAGGTAADGEPEITVEPAPPPITPDPDEPRRDLSTATRAPARRSTPPPPPPRRAEAMAPTTYPVGKRPFADEDEDAEAAEAAELRGTPSPDGGRSAKAVALPATASPTHAPAPIYWAPPVVRPPWMTAQPPASGTPRWIGPSEHPHIVSERRVHFLLVPQHVADLDGGQGRVRVTLMSSATGARIVHLKGLTTFVAILGGRPSPAVQLDQPSDIALVTPRAQEVGHIRVAIGSMQPDGHRVFPIGTELVVLANDDASDPILFDFGPGSDAYFVYTRGRPRPASTPPQLKPRRRDR